MPVYAQYSSPVGTLTLRAEDSALTGLWMELPRRPVPASFISCRDHAILRLTEDWLNRYFADARPDPAEIPIFLSGTAFQMQVLEILRTVPYGTKMTYGEIAGKLSPGMSAQAVGNAVGRNPISIIVPCHRILGAGGQLTGYAGGLERKEWLLRHEGIPYRR